MELGGTGYFAWYMDRPPRGIHSFYSKDQENFLLRITCFTCELSPYTSSIRYYCIYHFAMLGFSCWFIEAPILGRCPRCFLYDLLAKWAPGFKINFPPLQPENRNGGTALLPPEGRSAIANLFALIVQSELTGNSDMLIYHWFQHTSCKL